MGRLLNTLIVEGSSDDAEVLVGELRRSGFEPDYRLVSDRATLRRALRETTWDVVISDYAMPGLSGAEALACVRELAADLPFLLVSGRIGEEEAVALMRSGAQDYIMKGSLVRLGAAIERELHEADNRRARRDAERRYRELVERIPAVTYVASTDAPPRLLFVSPQVESWTGFSAGELLADPTLWWARIPSEDRQKIEQEIRQAIAEQRPFACEYRLRGRDDELFWIRDEAQLSAVEAGGALVRQGFWVDVTARRVAEDVATQALSRDRVTGLRNLASFEELLAGEIRRLAPPRAGLTVARIRLEGYRTLRNTFGHAHAHRVLREVGQRISNALPDSLGIARVSDEEFATARWLGPDEDPLDSLRGVREVLARPVRIDELSLGVDCVAGVALCPEHGSEPGALLRAAGVAIERAHARGVFLATYRADQDSFDPQSVVLLGALQEAITDRDLSLCWQPTLHLATGRIHGAEALARWRHARFGDIPPDRFVRLAEDSGFVDRFTHLILDLVLEQASRWRARGIELRLSANLSAKNLQQTEIVEEVARLLERWNVPASSLVLEVTEGALSSDPRRAKDVVTGLHVMGVKIAIDDFGTGYSTFDALRRYPISILKLDRSFVSNMLRNDVDEAIVHASIRLARHLGLEVTAEGVEDEPTLQRLIALGCDSVQGYHIARPMVQDDFCRFLASAGQARIEAAVAPDVESGPARVAARRVKG